MYSYFQTNHDFWTWHNVLKFSVVRVKEFLNEEYNSHDALQDAHALQKLAEAKLGKDIVFAHSFTTSSHIAKIEYEEDGKMLANTFSLMVKDKKLTPGMASKCGNSGLALRHLKLAYQREGDEGVKSLLQEKDENNKPRVTARRDIINSICQWLESDK